MRSSTFSSDLANPALGSPAHLDQPIEHLPASTASSAKPDPSAAQIRDRPIPSVPWLRMLAATAACVFLLVSGWEVEMRHRGLHAGDFDDGPDSWAVERRKVDAGPRDSVVIIGDSRILFDTDLATWQTLTGRRPIQLALPATNALPFLHDLASDEHFAGLVVIGTAEIAYFSDVLGRRVGVIDYVKKQSPSQWVGHELYNEASRHLAFLDGNYTVFKLIERRDWPERKGVVGPYMGVWKLSESDDDRQTHLWDRLEHDAGLREHARRVWMQVFNGDVVAPDLVERVIAKTKADVDRIRSRGGEVVWIRPPSAGPLLELELRRFPREKTWDRLLHDTGTFGVYFRDYPSMQHLTVPDWSHLSQSSALTFTNAYVRALRDRVDWLKVHSDAWLASKE